MACGCVRSRTPSRAATLWRRSGSLEHREPVTLDLDLGRRVGLQVQEPGGRRVGAALGRDDEVRVVVPVLEDQGVFALLTGLAALGEQDQDLGPVAPVVAVLTIGLE